MVGAALDAKVLLRVADAELGSLLTAMNPEDSLGENRIDALRYLVLASQVEVLESTEEIEKAEYKSIADDISVGIFKADGHKCDRCWNYSDYVGKSSEHPTICERCESALSGEF